MWDEFVLFIAVGFAAQMVDGAVGMAYGVSATSVMLSLGIRPLPLAPAFMPPRSLRPAFLAYLIGASAMFSGLSLRGLPYPAWSAEPWVPMYSRRCRWTSSNR